MKKILIVIILAPLMALAHVELKISGGGPEDFIYEKISLDEKGNGFFLSTSELFLERDSAKVGLFKIENEKKSYEEIKKTFGILEKKIPPNKFFKSGDLLFTLKVKEKSLQLSENDLSPLKDIFKSMKENAYKKPQKAIELICSKKDGLNCELKNVGKEKVITLNPFFSNLSPLCLTKEGLLKLQEKKQATKNITLLSGESYKIFEKIPSKMCEKIVVNNIITNEDFEKIIMGKMIFNNQ